MSKKITRKMFDTDFEYEEALRQMRKQSKTNRTLRGNKRSAETAE